MKQLIALTGIMALVLALGSSGALAADPERTFHYTAKFLCGMAGATDPVVPGLYSTAVSIQKSDGHGALVKFRVALTFPAPSVASGAVTTRQQVYLKQNEALEIDCEDILPLCGVDFCKGFILLKSNVRLNVLAVYAAENGNTGGESVHRERIPGRARLGRDAFEFVD
jgi:hypothetical protein